VPDLRGAGFVLTRLSEPFEHSFLVELDLGLVDEAVPDDVDFLPRDRVVGMGREELQELESFCDVRLVIVPAFEDVLLHFDLLFDLVELGLGDLAVVHEVLKVDL